MKKKWWAIAAAFALGAALKLLMRPQAPLAALCAAALKLGAHLRALSLSGAAGDAAVWALCLTAALLPAVYILRARRRRRQQSDVLWILAAPCLFGGMYILINPTMSQLIVPLAAMDASLLRFASLMPMGAALSLMLACVLLRWAGGLTDGGLIFWMRALLLAYMLLSAFFMGYSVASASPASLPLAAIAMLPDVFLLFLADAGRALLDTMRTGWYRAESERQAGRVAVLARRALAAAVCSMAARNALALLLGRWLSDVSMHLDLPLTEMVLSCGALLLARGIAAACRVQRENDLMI